MYFSALYITGMLGEILKLDGEATVPTGNIIKLCYNPK
jgi:hypothetical protein